MAKTRKIDMVILGLLAHENLTGYDIKKKFDHVIRFFWKGSFGSIYPSLSAMEQEGMVKRVTNDGTDSGREKIIYTITAAGQESLREWLKDSKATNDLKYETILKLYFGGSCDARVSIHTIEQFENEITEDLALLRIYEDSLSKVLDEKDHVHFYLTVLFGIETYEAYLRWSQRAKEILREKIL